jgi:hypothetical protein
MFLESVFSVSFVRIEFEKSPTLSPIVFKLGMRVNIVKHFNCEYVCYVQSNAVYIDLKRVISLIFPLI